MRGTLIVDEGDFRFSDEKAELVKILNNGNGRGFPVLRSESVSGKEFSPRAYSVFGPKLIATRGDFQDRAWRPAVSQKRWAEGKLRDDVPINLDAEYKKEALELRNKLLMFRFRNFSKCRVDPTLVDRSVEPRLAQVFVPLLSVIEDAAARQSLRELMQGYHRIISNTCASMYIPRSATSSRNAAIVIGTCNSIDWLRSRTASPPPRYLFRGTERFSLI